MRNRSVKVQWLTSLLLVSTAGAVSAQAADAIDPAETLVSALEPVLEGLGGKYGWLTTVLLTIGAARLVFKPLMLALEHALQSDPAKLARLQKFEAGPIYKAIAVVLDVGASIKLPLVKPPQK